MPNNSWGIKFYFSVSLSLCLYFYFFQTLLVCYCLFMCTHLCDDYVCYDVVLLDRMITGLSVPFLPRENAFVQSHTVFTNTLPPSSNKVYYVSAVPYRSDDNHSGTMEAATEGTSESFGPRDAQRSKLTNRCTATK